MGKRLYNEAKKQGNARYIAEKTDKIQAALPRGYADKLTALSEKLGLSKAQTVKSAIDMLYSSAFDEQQPTEQD